MFDMDIKYPVTDSWPVDAQKSIIDLRGEGFVEDQNAVVMRHATDPSVFYFLITDRDGKRHWMPLRTD